MRTLKVERVESFYVTTDEDEYPTYRRNGPGAWENLMGCSFEEVYDDTELERLFLEYTKINPAEIGP